MFKCFLSYKNILSTFAMPKMVAGINSHKKRCSASFFKKCNIQERFRQFKDTTDVVKWLGLISNVMLWSYKDSLHDCFCRKAARRNFGIKDVWGSFFMQKMLWIFETKKSFYDAMSCIRTILNVFLCYRNISMAFRLSKVVIGISICEKRCWASFFRKWSSGATLIWVKYIRDVLKQFKNVVKLMLLS